MLIVVVAVTEMFAHCVLRYFRDFLNIVLESYFCYQLLC